MNLMETGLEDLNYFPLLHNFQIDSWGTTDPLANSKRSYLFWGAVKADGA
jgi:hypothetical protein